MSKNEIKSAIVTVTRLIDELREVMDIYSYQEVDVKIVLDAAEHSVRLQQENKQLKELLRLAVGDMSIGWLCAVCSKRTKGKEWAMCQYQAFASVFDEERTVTCANFAWQHSDKLKGLI